MSDKKGLLPIVTEDVGFAVQAEFSEGKQSKYLADLLTRLSEGDNPCVANFISHLAISQIHCYQEIVSASLLLYRLLESQAEADKLNQKYKLD